MPCCSPSARLGHFFDDVRDLCRSWHLLGLSFQNESKTAHQAVRSPSRITCQIKPGLWHHCILSSTDRAGWKLPSVDLEKLVVSLDLLQAGLQGRPDHRDGIAARVKLFRWVRHVGDCDLGLA